MALNHTNLIPTKAALAKKAASADQFKFTSFESHKTKSLTAKHLKNKPHNDSETNNIFDIKRAKHEVFTFGTSGLKSKN